MVDLLQSTIRTLLIIGLSIVKTFGDAIDNVLEYLCQQTLSSNSTANRTKLFKITMLSTALPVLYSFPKYIIDKNALIQIADLTVMARNLPAMWIGRPQLPRQMNPRQIQLITFTCYGGIVKADGFGK